MLTKKNTILIKIKQNPIEYISFLSKCKMFSMPSLRKYLGRIADPIKKAVNAIINVIVRLWDSLFKESNKNPANRKMTISGLKMWFFKMLFLFKKPRKFSPGYNFLKKLLTHCVSINSKIVKMVVNKKDL